MRATLFPRLRPVGVLGVLLLENSFGFFFLLFPLKEFSPICVAMRQ